MEIKDKSDGPVQSADEKTILRNCIILLYRLVDSFQEYLELMNLMPDDEDDRYQYYMSYFEIVQTLFLWGTSHSGGTSTREKCRELGVDCDDYLHFDTREEGD